MAHKREKKLVYDCYINDSIRGTENRFDTVSAKNLSEAIKECRLLADIWAEKE